MGHAKLIKLLDKLTLRTVEGLLQWDETLESDAYKTSDLQYGLKVSLHGKNEQDRNIYVLEVMLFQSQRVIELINTSTINTQDEEGLEVIRKTGELYGAVSDGVVRVDYLVDVLLQQVDGLDIPF